jgi:hypothetical protein
MGLFNIFACVLIENVFYKYTIQPAGIISPGGEKYCHRNTETQKKNLNSFKQTVHY